MVISCDIYSTRSTLLDSCITQVTTPWYTLLFLPQGSDVYNQSKLLMAGANN